MVNFLILTILILIAIGWDLIGDYLYEKGYVKSVYIRKFHLEHEFFYLIIPLYIVLSYVKVLP